MEKAETGLALVNDSASAMSLDEVRDKLIRLEDTIVFSLIERAKYPINSVVYNESTGLVAGHHGSLIKFFMKKTEALHAQVKISTISYPSRIVLNIFLYVLFNGKLMVR